MLKNILNQKGVSVLSKLEQKSVHGGKCAVLLKNGEGEMQVVFGSKAEITTLGGNGGGNRWCCASCAEATWIDSTNIN